MATPPRKDSKTRGRAAEPRKAPRAGGKPSSRPGARTGAKAAPRAGAKAGPGSAPRTPRRPEAASEYGAGSWPVPKAESETGSGAESRPAARAGHKPAPRTGDKPAPRTGARPAPRTGDKPAPRAGARPGGTVKPRPKAKPGVASEQQGDRLQKILAAAGLDSRRACEAIILEGRVQVNGVTVTELGTRADPRRDEITVDLQPITRENLVYILLNKPKGYVTSVKDDQGRPTVMALIHGVEARVYPVGRLDFNSEGLLLMTNDGALALRLMAPEFHVPKVYLIKVHRMPRPETLDEFRGGFRLNGQHLKPCGIEIAEKADNPWLKVTLIEGKNQQLRRMFAAVGHPISKLKRIQFGPLDDPFLKPGEWRFLNPQELSALKNL